VQVQIHILKKTSKKIKKKKKGQVVQTLAFDPIEQAAVKQALFRYFNENKCTIAPFSDVVAHLIHLKQIKKLDVSKSWFKRHIIHRQLQFVVRAHVDGHSENLYCSKPKHDWSTPLVKYGAPSPLPPSLITTVATGEMKSGIAVSSASSASSASPVLPTSLEIKSIVSDFLMNTGGVAEFTSVVNHLRRVTTLTYSKRKFGNLTYLQFVKKTNMFNKKAIESLQFKIQTHSSGPPTCLYCGVPNYDWSTPLLLAVKSGTKKNRKERKAEPQTLGKTETTARHVGEGETKKQKVVKMASSCSSPIKKTSYVFRCLECHKRFKTWDPCKEHLLVKEHMKKQLHVPYNIETLQRYCIHPLLASQYNFSV